MPLLPRVDPVVESALSRWESEGGALLVPVVRSSPVVSVQIVDRRTRLGFADLVGVLIVAGAMREFAAQELVDACAAWRRSTLH